MKKIIFYVLLCISSDIFANQDSNSCAHWLSFLKPACKRLHHIWVDGNSDLYLSGYAWHNRYTYRPEKINSYNEAAWGTGLGKGLFNEKGDWEGIYALAFLDSHSHVEPAVGYAFLKVAHLGQNLRAGIGYTVLITQRADIFDGIPFPGALPWASVFYKNLALSATYIPGAVGAGNVLYVVGKITF